MSRVLSFLMVGWLLFSPRAARADQEIYATTFVSKVDVKKQRATIDRGKRGGVKLGDTGDIYGQRKHEGDTTPILDFDVRLARGKVVELGDDTAVVALDAIAGDIATATNFQYPMMAPDDLAEDPLFRAASRSVVLTPLETQVPFFTIEAMLADHSPALRAKVIEQMVADIKAARPRVAAVKDRIQGGRYHGMTVAETFDKLDAAQITDLLWWLDAFPGRYVGQRSALAAVFVSWAASGGDSGEPKRQLRLANPLVAKAQKATGLGKLDEARAAWQAVLKRLPDHAGATQALKRIDNVLLLQRQVATDPDDTANRFQLMLELYYLEAYALALAEYPALHKASYEPDKLERQRAFTLSRQEKWREAEAAFKQLLRDKPEDKDLLNWMSFVRASGRVAKDRDDVAAHLDLAAVQILYKSWDDALAEYRAVLGSTRATPKQHEAAARAQERISIEREIEVRVAWAIDDVQTHAITDATDRLAQLMRLADQLKDAPHAAEVLGKVAAAATAASEDDFAIEVFQKQVGLSPTLQSAHTALAAALLSADRLDEAEAEAKKALGLKGDSTDYANLLLSYTAGARGDTAEMEKRARAASVPKYSWPLIELARAAALRDDWDDAVDQARKAWALQDEYSMRNALTAVLRGQQASDALRANPSSARERLRLIRALADLGFHKRVADEIAKLPADGSWRTDAWWSLSESVSPRVPLAERLTAARNTKPTTELRKQRLAFLEAQSKLRSLPKDAATRQVLARMYLQREDPDRALATLSPLVTGAPAQAVNDLFRDARDGLAMSGKVELARAALTREDFATADQLTVEALTYWDRIGGADAGIRLRMLRSEIAQTQGKFQDSIAFLEAARARAAALGDVSWVSILDRSIATSRSNLGSVDVVYPAFDAALKQCDELDDEFCLMFVHLQLANFKTDENLFADAIDHARKAWQFADRVGRADLARNARFLLADANLAARRPSDAEQIALPLLQDSRKAGDVENEKVSLLVLGAVALQRGLGPQSRARFQEVYDLGTRTGDTFVRANARRLEGLSWLNVEHDYNRAATSLEQAAVLFEKTPRDDMRGTVLRALAEARIESGKLAAAKEACGKAMVIAQKYQRRPQLAYNNALLALIAIKENKPAEAVAAATEAVKLVAQTDDQTLSAFAWHALANSQVLNKQDQPAFDAYEKALEALGRALMAVGGDADRSGYMNIGTTRRIYKDAVAHYIKMGKTARAMEVLELSRDAQLKQSFDATAVKTKDKKLRANLDKYEETRDRVNGLEKQLEQAQNKPAAQRSAAQVKALGQQIAKTREQLKEVALDLKVTHRHLYRALALDPDTLMERRTELPKGSVIVEYFVADDALYAFVITAALTQPAVVKVNVTSADLAKTVSEYRAAVLQESGKTKARDKVEQLGRKLDGWLLEPLRSHLDGATTVILLPFGPLYYVPFDALVVSEEGKPVRYAIEDFRLSIQTATTLEYLMKAPRARGTGAMLAVANPDGSLPGAQKEVSRITKSMPDARVLGRKDGTVKKFSEVVGGYRYVHIATHGLLDADPRKSYLKMSDGQLTVRDIAKLQGLDQTNELVVLSACESATEQGETAGDELVSLAVSFAMAGAPALVASLWEVDDDSTSELMATFYRALEANGGDRLEALRTAKLNLMRFKQGTNTPYAAPWHWASFQMFGDFRAAVAK